jgi:hypothetical protein
LTQGQSDHGRQDHRAKNQFRHFSSFFRRGQRCLPP